MARYSNGLSAYSNGLFANQGFRGRGFLSDIFHRVGSHGRRPTSFAPRMSLGPRMG